MRSRRSLWCLLLAVASAELAACGDPASQAPADAGVISTVPPEDGGTTPEDAGTLADAGSWTPADVAMTVLSGAGTSEQPVEAIVYGDVFRVRVEGLRPGARVRLTARMKNMYYPSMMWASSAQFEVPTDGKVDTAQSASVEGDYLGVDADGLVWSMSQASRPSDFQPAAFTLYFAAETEAGEVLAQAQLVQLAHAQGVRRIEVRENGLYGVLYLPASPTPRPPVITFGGSEGGLFAGEWFAMQVASYGFPALGLAYFGAPGLPAQLERIPLGYFDTAIDWLKARPDVDGRKIVVMGASRGGELALLLGATYPQISAVVAWEPSAWLWGSVSSTEKPAWSLAGQDLAFVPPSATAAPGYVSGPGGASAVAMTPYFHARLQHASADALDAAAIKVEDIKGPVLLLGGADDQLWPSCDFQETIMARLEAKGHTQQHASASVCYSAAGHNLTFVGGPTTGSMWSYQAGWWYSMGGTAGGIAQGQRAADTRLRQFLAEQLGSTPDP